MTEIHVNDLVEWDTVIGDTAAGTVAALRTVAGELVAVVDPLDSRFLANVPVRYLRTMERHPPLPQADLLPHFKMLDKMLNLMAPDDGSWPENLPGKPLGAPDDTTDPNREN